MMALAVLYVAVCALVVIVGLVIANMLWRAAKQYERERAQTHRRLPERMGRL
jgi:type II secretory pathway component PulK